MCTPCLTLYVCLCVNLICVHVCLLAALIYLPVAALIWTAALIPFESDSITRIPLLVLWTNSPQDTETERKKGRSSSQDSYCLPSVALGHCVLQLNNTYCMMPCGISTNSIEVNCPYLFNDSIAPSSAETAKMTSGLQRALCSLFVNCRKW